MLSATKLLINIYLGIFFKFIAMIFVHYEALRTEIYKIRFSLFIV